MEKTKVSIVDYRKILPVFADPFTNGTQPAVKGLLVTRNRSGQNSAGGNDSGIAGYRPRKWQI